MRIDRLARGGFAEEGNGKFSIFMTINMNKFSSVLKNWTKRNGSGRWRFRQPDRSSDAHRGYDYGWEFLFDQIHHRGQISTYLRPMGAKVPAIIGPSADEAS